MKLADIDRANYLLHAINGLKALSDRSNAVQITGVLGYAHAYVECVDFEPYRQTMIAEFTAKLRDMGVEIPEDAS